MSIGDTTVTVVGNLTADPDLRFTDTGVPVASFTIAASRRVFDREANKWQDGDTLFLRCSVWRHLAEHSAESLTRGMRVIASGRLKQRDYQDKDGVKRTVFEVDVEEVGPSLRYATAKVVKAARDTAPHPADGHRGGPGRSDDPWMTGGGNSGGGFSDDPPF